MVSEEKRLSRNAYQNKRNERKRQALSEEAVAYVRGANISEEGSPTFKAAVVVLLLAMNVRQPAALARRTGYGKEYVRELLGRLQDMGVYDGKMVTLPCESEDDFDLALTVVAMTAAKVLVMIKVEGDKK